MKLPSQQVKILDDALHAIGEVAVPLGGDWKAALIEAQNIAEMARREAGTLSAKVLPMPKLKDVRE